jgi:two-component system, chemotaxis family, CheB/CheR fusion protein
MNSATEDDQGTSSTLSAVSRVVGVGASAGGLEALQEFLGPLTPDGSAIIVAQHLAPDHPTLLVELLSRATPFEVEEAVDGSPLRTNIVTVVPPNHDLTLVGDRLALVEAAERVGPSPSIDLLFESLVQSWGERAVGVILSGTGSDGARGLRAIRAAGGLTMVQLPESARFDGMPRAALALGNPDVVADAGDLGPRLAEIPTSVGVGGAKLPPVEDGVIPQVVAQLRRSIGIDFADYKPSTLKRQVQRRMAVRQIDVISDYVALLAAEPDEAQALKQNLLVTVTSFFRDPEAFQVLRDALGTYLARPGADEVLRVWVPGCATGEEVYSIAMIVGDLMGRPADLARRLKIFGTDLDDASLALARRAVYPASALSRIPEPLRSAYARQGGDSFQVADVLRECVVFALHDVGADPPFPRIDVISCRNTLIYFTSPLQRRVIRRFDFALRSGGLLFLGESEGLGRHCEGFTVVDAGSRIFRHSGESLPSYEHVPQPFFADAARQTRPAHRPLTLEPERDVAQIALLEQLVRFSGDAYVVLDDRHRPIRVVGDVSSYCRVPEGSLAASVSSFLREELRDEARALLLLCRGSNEPVSGQSLSIEGIDHPFHMVAKPIQVGEESLTLLAFVPDAGLSVGSPTLPDRSASFDRELKRLEQEVLVSQDALRRSLAELQSVNEELEASSEELQASSEELQASNEELQASNEELQATNEELAILNQESFQRGDFLQHLNTHLANVEASVNQGMVIVDQDLRVTRFTPLAVRVFGLVDTDVGLPVLSARTTLPIPGLDAALHGVLGGGPRLSIQARDDEVCYLVQVLPYKDSEGLTLGAIITLTDVTELDSLRATAEATLAELQVKSELLEGTAFDSVTGLLNRKNFSDALANEISQSSRAGSQLALAWIDLDRFKEVNDEHGHDAGDVTLRTASARLLEVVRSTDVVGRLGGDEIGVLIVDYKSPGELDAVLDRLLDALRQPIEIDGRETRISGSIGVALFPEDAHSPEDLLVAADAAMYEVKKRLGDGAAYFTPSMSNAAAERRRMRIDIGAAIESCDFELHYQPIVHAMTNVVWGVEALVRWRRDGQLVPACDFIDFCEQSGQIRALGLLTLELMRNDLPIIKATRQEDLRIAFNVSVTQLEDRNFLNTIAAIDPPHRLGGLVVEIVESVFLPGRSKALELLDSLVALGAEACIDDYGSGYSNIGLLQALTPAYIKLDRSFLSQQRGSETRAALIRSAVEISHVIGAKVVVEGVEDDEHRALARDAGAEYVQGYAIARPMPLADLTTWLADHPSQA